VEAIGLSKNLSYDEAFADALKNLPPSKNPHPDQRLDVTVIESTGQFGGFAGLHQLAVKIRGTYD
jgi:hypothetical protein